MGSLPALSDVGDETLARYKQMLELDWKCESYALKPSPPLGCVPGSPANAPAAAEAKEPRGGGADVIKPPLPGEETQLGPISAGLHGAGGAFNVVSYYTFDRGEVRSAPWPAPPL